MDLDLWQACLNGEKEAVKKALDTKGGADINWKNPDSKVITMTNKNFG